MPWALQVAPDLRVTRRFLADGVIPECGRRFVIIDPLKEEGMTAEDLAEDIAPTGKPIATVNIRGDGGFISAVEKATRYAQDFARQISLQAREAAPMSKILFGTECGTSDTTSGLASNPANGLAGELLIAQGGRMLMAECTEWMGCENWLTDKAANPAVAEAILAGVQHMEARALASGEDIRGSPADRRHMAGGDDHQEKSMARLKRLATAQISELSRNRRSAKQNGRGNYCHVWSRLGAESSSSMARPAAKS